MTDNRINYTNPISEQANIVLAAVQRAAIRVAYAQQFNIDDQPMQDQRDILVDLARDLYGNAHDDALSDAFLGEYDAGDRSIAVFPQSESKIRFRD